MNDDITAKNDEDIINQAYQAMIAKLFEVYWDGFVSENSPQLDELKRRRFAGEGRFLLGVKLAREARDKAIGLLELIDKKYS